MESVDLSSLSQPMVSIHLPMSLWCMYLPGGQMVSHIECLDATT